MDFQQEDTEELEQMNDMGINANQELDAEEDKDEFSDNEGYDPDDMQKEDY